MAFFKMIQDFSLAGSIVTVFTFCAYVEAERTMSPTQEEWVFNLLQPFQEGHTIYSIAGNKPLATLEERCQKKIDSIDLATFWVYCSIHTCVPFFPAERKSKNGESCSYCCCCCCGGV